MADEPDGKRQKQDEKSHTDNSSDDEEIEDGEDTEEEEYESEEESEEMKTITEKLAQANMLIEEAEMHDFQDQESVRKAGDIFQSVLGINKDQIEGHLGLAYVSGINGKFDEVNNYIQAAVAINPHDDRIEQVQQQIKDIQTGKGKEKVNVPKLIENNTLSERFVTVLQEIFAFFDKNKDGALSPTELDAFTRVVNGQPINKQTIRYMRDNLDWAPNKGLTQEGFFQLYVSQTIGDSNETWDDLGKLGYNKDLEKM